MSTSAPRVTWTVDAANVADVADAPASANEELSTCEEAAEDEESASATDTGSSYEDEGESALTQVNTDLTSSTSYLCQPNPSPRHTHTLYQLYATFATAPLMQVRRALARDFLAPDRVSFVYTLATLVPSDSVGNNV